jgi:hypothetical protein
VVLDRRSIDGFALVLLRLIKLRHIGSRYCVALRRLSLSIAVSVAPTAAAATPAPAPATTLAEVANADVRALLM